MITIKIGSTGNDAFHEDVRGEVARILHDAADKIARGENPRSLFDINGNFVGTVTTEEETA